MRRAASSFEAFAKSVARKKPCDRRDEIANLRSIEQQDLLASHANDRAHVDPVTEFVDQSTCHQLQLSLQVVRLHLSVPRPRFTLS